MLPVGSGLEIGAAFGEITGALVAAPPPAGAAGATGALPPP